jgi:hypothetical protein
MKYTLHEIHLKYFDKFVFKKTNAYIEDMISNHYYPKVLIVRNKISNLMNSILIK